MRLESNDFEPQDRFDCAAKLDVVVRDGHMAVEQAPGAPSLLQEAASEESHILVSSTGILELESQQLIIPNQISY